MRCCLPPHLRRGATNRRRGAADLIVVLHDGQIVESGSYQELMRAAGEYESYIGRTSMIDVYGGPVDGSPWAPENVAAR